MKAKRRSGQNKAWDCSWAEWQVEGDTLWSNCWRGWTATRICASGERATLLRKSLQPTWRSQAPVTPETGTRGCGALGRLMPWPAGASAADPLARQGLQQLSHTEGLPARPLLWHPHLDNLQLQTGPFLAHFVPVLRLLDPGLRKPCAQYGLHQKLKVSRTSWVLSTARHFTSLRGHTATFLALRDCPEPLPCTASISPPQLLSPLTYPLKSHCFYRSASP